MTAAAQTLLQMGLLKDSGVNEHMYWFALSWSVYISLGSKIYNKHGKHCKGVFGLCYVVLIVFYSLSASFALAWLLTGDLQIQGTG